MKRQINCKKKKHKLMKRYIIDPRNKINLRTEG